MHTLFLEGFPRSFNHLSKTVHNYNMRLHLFLQAISIELVSKYDMLRVVSEGVHTWTYEKIT